MWPTMDTRRPYIPRILLAFDFDRTLATDSVDAVCAAYGVTRADWTRDHEEALGDNWDEILRRGTALIALGEAKGRPFSKTVCAEAAAHVDLYPGVIDMPDRLRAVAEEIAPDVALDFVVLSSGYDELISHTPVADAFDRVLASGFESAADGDTLFAVKRIIGHPEKALYLEALGKGADIDGANGPERAGDPVAPDDMHCPFDQMIYLGDGDSDLQAFGFLHQVGGLTLAVASDGPFRPDQQTQDQRVDAAPAPDYSPGAPLMEALEHAVRACAHRVALRAVGAGIRA